MPELVRVAIDAMGGDNAPGTIIEGTVLALNESDELFVYLVGDEEAITKGLSACTYDKSRLEIVPTTEVITNDEHPALAIRHKNDSSIVVGERLVSSGKADAFVSGGSTGAVLVGGQLIVGRIRGIERPALGSIVPTTEGFSLIIDCGANVDAKPSQLLQYAKMGSIYLESALGKKNPTVALLNLGAEEEKGNKLVRESFPLFKECKEINFTGSIESRDVPYGKADIIICDAFAGNIVLKMYEGVACMLLDKVKETFMTNLKTKIGALLIKDQLKITLKNYDMSKYGGAPMLGLKGLVAKVHGNASPKEVKNSLLQCISFKRGNIIEKITESIKITANE
ncbi:MAG: phosphate acyltransferase PlsX [Lachnospiraceae bacterium]|nr:phosphate acyltransferase PlsX [Lachnospiraceae bacterium]